MLLFSISSEIDLIVLLRFPSLSFSSIMFFCTSLDVLSYLFLSLINDFLLLNSTRDSLRENNLFDVVLINSSFLVISTLIFCSEAESLEEEEFILVNLSSFSSLVFFFCSSIPL